MCRKIGVSIPIMGHVYTYAGNKFTPDPISPNKTFSEHIGTDYVVPQLNGIIREGPIPSRFLTDIPLDFLSVTDPQQATAIKPLSDGP